MAPSSCDQAKEHHVVPRQGLHAEGQRAQGGPRDGPGRFIEERTAAMEE